ncbi:hypothetical protein [Acetonema longum]|uniref:Uncharacterized protein n=1 Tax=Acetonema longum DSM 6540 TaxID=1009370 RepID=F7NH36_9FIRM|nr:hypothetical protein [Acetonema longum]EGO64638.1 hypothetical protein ALO_06898 [Acetonema longum DSM 6540]
MKKSVQHMLIVGAVLAGSGAAWLLASLPVNAAVAVIDARNIAINTKTAANTELTSLNLIKQLALDLLNIKGIDGGVLGQYSDGIANQQRGVQEKMQAFQGIMGQDSAGIWDEEGGRIEDILGGSFDAGTYLNVSGSSYKALESTSRDSIELAKTVQKMNSDTTGLQQALKNSAEAEGQKQAQQADTQVAAVTAASQLQETQLIAQQTGMMAESYLRENQEKAAAKAILDLSAANTHRTVQNAIVRQPADPQEVLNKIYPDWLAKEYE